MFRRRLIVCGPRPEYALDADWADKWYLPARMIAAVRPGDVIILPGGYEPLRDFVAAVCPLLGIDTWQIWWTSGTNYLLDADIEAEVIPSLQQLMGEGSGWELLPCGVHQGFTRWASRFPAARVLGDAESWCDRYATKAVLHPPVREQRPPVAAFAGVPIPRGYTCVDKGELLRGARMLGEVGIAEFVVKPVIGTTGEGIVFVSGERGVGAAASGAFSMGDVVIEERLPVDKDLDGHVIAPSLQFVGGRLLGEPLDQVMNGVAFAGNIGPSRTPHRFQRELVSQARRVLAALRPQGPGGFDFLSVGGRPVLVDPNLGRLTGAHPPRMFMETHAPTARAFMTWKVHDAMAPIDAVISRLSRRSILFQRGQAGGVFPLCYLPGAWSMLLSFGDSRKEVENLRAEADQCLG